MKVYFKACGSNLYFSPCFIARVYCLLTLGTVYLKGKGEVDLKFVTSLKACGYLSSFLFPELR